MSSTPLPPLGSLAVLLVEDDPTNRLIALSMLRHLGVDADAAGDGREGVRMAAHAPYDVVLMDIQMPVMDGVEAMKAIRALTPPQRCPRVLAVTAHAVAGTRERLLAAGFDGFYAKPLTISTLHAALAPTLTLIIRAPHPGRQAHEAEASAALVAAVRAHVCEMLGEEDEAFLHELVESFAASSQQAIAAVESARGAGDSAAVARAAHQLKGSASNVGLGALTERWGRIETSIRTGAADGFGDGLDAAVAETARTVGMLEAALH